MGASWEKTVAKLIGDGSQWWGGSLEEETIGNDSEIVREDKDTYWWVRQTWEAHINCFYFLREEGIGLIDYDIELLCRLGVCGKCMYLVLTGFSFRSWSFFPWYCLQVWRLPYMQGTEYITVTFLHFIIPHEWLTHQFASCCSVTGTKQHVCKWGRSGWP